MTKFRVLLNTVSMRLIITTDPIVENYLEELFTSSCNANDTQDLPDLAKNNCKIFCQGYLQGNTGHKVLNDLNEFV